MTQQMRSMLTLVGIVTLGGVGFWMYTPTPANRTMAELRDAGIADWQPYIQVCSEQIGRATWRRIDANQPGFLRPKQKFARVARTARCFNPDGGNCFKAATWAPLVGELEGVVMVPSLRTDLDGGDTSVTANPDGGDTNAIDDGDSYDKSTCIAVKCAAYDAGAAPGIPWGATPCGALNRVWAETPLCVLPDCRLPDGGWDDHAGEPGYSAAPDCRALTEPPLGGPATPLFLGCNAFAASRAVGTKCIPVECGMLSGAGSIQDVLLGY